jgi:hypothetical protein
MDKVQNPSNSECYVPSTEPVKFLDINNNSNVKEIITSN